MYSANSYIYLYTPFVIIIVIVASTAGYFIYIRYTIYKLGQRIRRDFLARLTTGLPPTESDTGKVDSFKRVKIHPRGFAGVAVATKPRIPEPMLFDNAYDHDTGVMQQGDGDSGIYVNQIEMQRSNSHSSLGFQSISRESAFIGRAAHAGRESRSNAYNQSLRDPESIHSSRPIHHERGKGHSSVERNRDQRHRSLGARSGSASRLGLHHQSTRQHNV